MKLKNAYNLAIIFATGMVVFALSRAAAAAEEPKKVPRVGVLVTGSGSYVGRDAFPQTLRELGYIEGHNIALEYRSADGKNVRQPELARELVNMNVDVLVSGGGNDVTRALMQATKTIPIVMTAGSDAVARGLISSLARPGGNVTGLTSLWDDLTGKRLELLKTRSRSLHALPCCGTPAVDGGHSGRRAKPRRGS
jgi:putative tryptophan/tyrosine transport system substrate-binding protein